MVDWLSLDYAKWRVGDTGEPLYRRIVALVRQLISEGALVEGDALPAERDLAKLMGVSRGTVGLAFDELKRERIVTAAPGRGTVVASDQYVNAGSRKEQAIRLLTNALERCEALGFTPREVEAFLHLVLLGRTGQEVQVRGLLVDCNPEALALLSRQLARVTHLDLSSKNLEELGTLDAETVASLDVVMTTETHAAQVTAALARFGFPLERVLALAVAPSRETLVATARLTPGVALKVQTQSAKFAEIVRSHLAALGHADVTLHLHPAEADGAYARIESADGQNVQFGYEVDRGSWMRVEEVVTALLLHKGEGVLGGQVFGTVF